ncbi:delta-class carbonic anhydrase [Tropicibacter naphthalenivorans]|uniref:Cadmium carbonic anhydrase n=1 Tax=Tropicibacter naphthalenivorans TaxID=441103 RepID=A0A0P1G5N9_9RHOB|nr:delta-class carbonic anhydrase [Tropicibacter naphthalenivorans]CUH76906.1 hypothetical protein TRN7648_01185 [Tropicibacter naphthalenivorans]SMC62378.1 Cadmium carbonic anhydrase repeat-containing protein [Tropicibacter naphthalenivorans]
MLPAFPRLALALALGATALASPAFAICTGFGPQTPRDISNTYGRNPVTFGMAPPASSLNLCNIHTHTNAEHMGPGFSIFAGDREHGGFKCSGSNNLTEEELTRPGKPAKAAHGDDHGDDHADDGHGGGDSHAASKDDPHGGGHGGFQAVEPGDTIEVHWVYSSCNIEPGKGLGACLSDGCANPQLRVESQVFLVVNDPNALDFMDFVYRGTMRNGLHQPRSLPTGTGTPVVFRGSTTGTSYDQNTCSPLQVTWSVRPRCARLDISSLDAWADAGNVFEENHSHGVRQLVTSPELLAPIE